MPSVGLHQIADRAGRPRPRDERGRDPAFLLGLLVQRRDDAVAVADAAGDDVVELVRRDPLVRRAAADPQMQPAVDKAVAVQMDAIGAHAEKRHRAAVEPEQRRLAPARHDVEGLVAPFRDLPLDDERLDDIVDSGADGLDIALGDEPDALLLDREDTRKSGERGGIVGRQPADAPSIARQQRDQAGGVGIVAGADVIGEGHR